MFNYAEGRREQPDVSNVAFGNQANDYGGGRRASALA